MVTLLHTDLQASLCPRSSSCQARGPGFSSITCSAAPPDCPCLSSLKERLGAQKALWNREYPLPASSLSSAPSSRPLAGQQVRRNLCHLPT